MSVLGSYLHDISIARAGHSVGASAAGVPRAPDRTRNAARGPRPGWTPRAGSGWTRSTALDCLVLPHTGPAMWQSCTQVSATMDESAGHLFVTALAARSRVDLGGGLAWSGSRVIGARWRKPEPHVVRTTAEGDTGFAHEDSISEVDPDGWSSGGSARDSA